MKLLREHDLAVLTRDVPDAGLVAGDVGTVVYVHPDGAGGRPGYEIEFATVAGEPVAVVGVPADAVRPAARDDRYHARPAATGPR
jgi:hypothetical protein